MRSLRFLLIGSGFLFLLTACGGGGGGSSTPPTNTSLSAVANTTAQSLTVGTAMPSFTPLTASGGTPPYTYGYTGTLPAGLSFNASTGVVTGTPTAVYASADLVFTVSDTNNNVASTSSMVNFTVVAAPTSAGALDMSFNLTGQVFTDINSSLDGIQAIAIQSNGKIVAVGSAQSSTGLDFALVRYNLDGSLDTSFGSNGKVITDFNSGSDVAQTVAIQADGKIIAAGYTTGGSGLAMARYNTDGTLDTTFGAAGKVTTNLGTVDFANSIGLQSDGKIIVGSTASAGFGLARYNTDGTLDTTFGTSGKVATTLTVISGTPLPGYDSLRAIAIQSDDKIVAAGQANPSFDFGVVRYNADGSLDTTFNSTGKVITDIGGVDDVSSLAIQSDGKIVVAGTTMTATDFALVRYATDGSVDTTFGTNGIVTTSTTGSVDLAKAVAIQSDGKIVVAGTELVGGTSAVFMVERFNTDGSLDTSFDADGKVTTDLGHGGAVAYAMAIEPSGNTAAGNIVVAGTSNNDFALVRYLH